MREFLLPYGKETLKAEIEEEHLAGVLVSELHDYKAPMEGSRLVQEALEHPIGTPRLCDMAIDKKKVVVISSDHTRPVPSHIIMHLILKEIRRGNPDAEITILISTGLHRETTREELESKFGPEITENETIIVHDCLQAETCISTNWQWKQTCWLRKDLLSPISLPDFQAVEKACFRAWPAVRRLCTTITRPLSTIPTPGPASLRATPFTMTCCTPPGWRDWTLSSMW